MKGMPLLLVLMLWSEIIWMLVGMMLGMRGRQIVRREVKVIRG